jgi:hypothetical protein
VREAVDGPRGRYADVRGGGGVFPERPSPPSGRAAALVLQEEGRLLRMKARMPEAARLMQAGEIAMRMSVRAAVEAIETQPG